MDFIKGLSNSNGKNTILVLVDCVTKYAHFISVIHLFMAKKMLEVYVESAAHLHGIL